MLETARGLLLPIALALATSCSLRLPAGPSGDGGGPRDADTDGPGDGDADTDADGDAADADADVDDGGETDAEPDADAEAGCDSLVVLRPTLVADSLLSEPQRTLNWGGSEILSLTREGETRYAVWAFDVAAADLEDATSVTVTFQRVRTHSADCGGACPHAPGTFVLHALRVPFDESTVTYATTDGTATWDIGPAGADRVARLGSAEVEEETDELTVEVTGEPLRELASVGGTLPLLGEMTSGTFVACAREHPDRCGARLEIRRCEE